MQNLIKSKNGSLTLVFFYYVISFYLAYLVTKNFDSDGWLHILIWHVSATLIIFLFSNVHRNSSIYDPFWHVAPILIVFYIAKQSSLPTLELNLVLGAFLFWALRLTYNWYLNWNNLDHEDFRYIDLKNNNKFMAFINDLFGIHLIPTIIVNVSLYPIYVALTAESLNKLVYVGFIVIIIAVVIQYISDDQMRKFRKNESNLGKTMKYGLW